jgi:hypothetical protein
MVRRELPGALLWAATVIASCTLHPTLALAQLTRDRVIAGATVGVSDLHSPISGHADVVTGVVRYQRAVLSVEFGFPTYSYMTKVAVSPDVLESSLALAPELSLQLNRRFRSVEFYLGAGPGLAIPLMRSTLSGPTIHATGGLRLRVAEGLLARLDLRTRRVSQEPSMTELQVGLEGWPR